jgi:hypothetical protein
MVHFTSLLVFAVQLYETPPPPPYDNKPTPARAAVRVFRLESSAQNSEQDRLLTASKYTRNCSARQRTGVCGNGAWYPTGTTVLSNERLQNLSLGDQDCRPQHSGWLVTISKCSTSWIRHILHYIWANRLETTPGLSSLRGCRHSHLFSWLERIHILTWKFLCCVNFYL